MFLSLEPVPTCKTTTWMDPQCEFLYRWEEIPTHRIFFVLRDQWIGIEQMPTISDIWWMLREEAEIYIRQDDGIVSGKHDVECTMEISTLTNTRIVDKNDLYPRLILKLQSQMARY